MEQIKNIGTKMRFRQKKNTQSFSSITFIS
jgi:hypothetical protein